MRHLLPRLTFLWLVPICAGCSSPAHDRGDAAPVVDAADATDAPPDTSSADTVEVDAGVACGSMTCAAGQICTHERGGTDASPIEDHCYALPSGCGGVPSCSCITSLSSSFRCGMSCQQTGEREFVCNA